MKTKFKYVMVTVSYKKVRGKLREFYHVRISSLETERFPFGLALEGKTLSKEVAEKYAADVEQYIESWLTYEKEGM